MLPGTCWRQGSCTPSSAVLTEIKIGDMPRACSSWLCCVGRYAHWQSPSIDKAVKWPQAIAPMLQGQKKASEELEGTIKPHQYLNALHFWGKKGEISEVVSVWFIDVHKSSFVVMTSFTSDLETLHALLLSLPWLPAQLPIDKVERFLGALDLTPWTYLTTFRAQLHVQLLILSTFTFKRYHSCKRKVIWGDSGLSKPSELTFMTWIKWKAPTPESEDLIWRNAFHFNRMSSEEKKKITTFSFFIYKTWRIIFCLSWSWLPSINEIL